MLISNSIMKLSQAKKDKGVYCCAYGCKNPPAPRKGGLCHKHYHRQMKERDPVAQRYMQFRSKSKYRGIENSVTLEEFRKFCVDNDYIVKKGNRGKRCTIDRRCNIHGYHIWNMQILTLRRNASKGNRFAENDFPDPKTFYENNEEIPF